MNEMNTRSTYTVRMANAFFWAEFHINAETEAEVRFKAQELAGRGTLAFYAEQEYQMALRKNGYDPDRRDYTYRLERIEPADIYDPRANDAPHPLTSS
jgi:hypothetical protein